MSSPEFSPSRSDITAGVEGYLLYLAGVAILHNPDETEHIHRLDMLNDDHVEALIYVAQTRMVEGAKTVIKMANPLDTRKSLKRMTHRFDAARPNMQNMVERTYERYPKRVLELGGLVELDAIRPAAMLNQHVYGHLCYGQPGRLTLESLMDGLAMDPHVGFFGFERRVGDTQKPPSGSIFRAA